MEDAKTLNFKSGDFVHLHLHTDYSLLESAIQLKPLVKQLNQLEMAACAITDFGNMYGAISFYNSMKAGGIHPILGYEAFITPGSRFEKSTALKSGERPYYQVVLLARDLEGYHNLAHLASKAFTEGLYYKPRIDLDLLASHANGLIGLSGGLRGPVWHFLEQQNLPEAERQAKLFEEILGKDNFFLEIQSHDLPGEKQVQSDLVDLSRRTGIPLVAANEAHYLTPDDARAHELLYCIAEGKTVNDLTRTTLKTPTYYLRSAAEMWEIFGRELPDALRRTTEIAERCRLKLPSGDNLTLPRFPIPAESNCRTTDEYFEKVVLEGFQKRKMTVWTPMQREGTLKHPNDVYRQRIEAEIGLIEKMGFPGYFLIVWDFIRYAREKGIPVGPGRGSAAGSLVAYCLEITDVDPIQYDLLFERFLNPERISMPDIDIDFCVRGRGEVINHVTEVYGRDSVCQIITFGTMASKAAIKDVGRALDVAYSEVEKIAKMIPPPVRGRNVSIGQALEQVEDLRKAIAGDPKVKELVDLARRLEGCARHSSVHAAGVVISPQPLHELIPIAVSSKNELTSQYTMTDLEKVGMLKMDFLALTTLTIISDCLKSLKDKAGVEIDWSLIRLDDEKAMALFGEGRTEAIFQFESSGMQEICRRLKPKELEDLAALNALYRPGPLDGGMVDDFIARHRGEKRVSYLVAQMKDILHNTYGILVYQEQIMQLAQQLAGYSLGEADMMRRAMGKKKREEMAVHEEKFVSGAVERGIARDKAEKVFDLMKQFADYGFNRSHSVAYAYLAFQTAYLKAHYPAYFYASVLSNESQDTTKIYKYSNELRHAGLKLLPPDVNESDAGFTPLDNAVRFGLNAIKGIGSSTVQAILEARRGGRFSSLFDFTSRLEQGAISRRGLESLISAGAFDSIKPVDQSISLWRARLFAGIDPALSQAQKAWNDKIRGQSALFGDAGDGLSAVEVPLPLVAPWTQLKVSQEEKAAVGFYLSNHPLDEHLPTLEGMGIKNMADYGDVMPGEKITVAGIVSGFQVKHSKKGNRFCIFKLEDQSNGVKCLGWSDAYEKFRDFLKEDELLIVGAKVESNEGQEMTLIIDEVTRLDDAVPLKSQRLSLTIPADGADERFLEEIFALLSKNQGKCDVNLRLCLDSGVKIDILSQPLRIQGSKSLEKDLSARGCEVAWHLKQ
jgi:DNA polymerase-3 subunit alpha